MTALWLQTALAPVKAVAAQAGRYESDGWDGVMVFDSQCLIADPYVVLALAAAATTRLGLGIGVTNPATRHAAVTASAIAAIQEASGGRAVLGVGRGNSSLAYLGAAPASLADFEAYLRALQALLAGRGAPLPAGGEGLRPLQPGSLGRAPDETRLHWLDPALPKVPVEVACTGPRAIALGARLGDRVSFSIGADEARLAEAVAAARAAGAARLTAYVSVAALADGARARRLAAPDVAMHAHILAMSPANMAALPPSERAVVAKIAAAYDMTRHGRHGAQTEVVDEAFVEAHAVVGSPQSCLARLRRLAGLGLDRLVLMLAPPLKSDAQEAYENVVRRILPAFRENVN